MRISEYPEAASLTGAKIVGNTAAGNTSLFPAALFSVTESISAAVIDLVNGATEGSVTGLSLSATPTAVFLTVEIPANGLVIAACLVGSPTTDGFSYALTGAPDSSAYHLHYLIVL